MDLFTACDLFIISVPVTTISLTEAFTFLYLRYSKYKSIEGNTLSGYTNSLHSNELVL